MLKNFAIAAIIFLLVLPVGLWWFVERRLPALDGAGLVTCLGKPVIVKYDGRAVPYIEALSPADAFAAQGYVTARERMFQMDLARREAAGELSEIFGSSALPSDRLMRTLGMRRLAEKELGCLSGLAREALESYALGVNAYLAENADRLPLEFLLCGYTPSRWTAVDSLCIIKHLGYQLDESWRLDDLRQRAFDKIGQRLYSELFKDDWSPVSSPWIAPAPTGGSVPLETERPARISAMQGQSGQLAVVAPMKKSESPLVHVGQTGWSNAGDVSCSGAGVLLRHLTAMSRESEFLPGPRPLWGSTAWVVPASASAAGSALLACDKHNFLANPGAWFICSLRSPELHVAGATVPGVPGVAVGRNESICWGGVALKADVQDLFLEQFQSQFATSYRTPSGWTDAQVVTEVIPVRFARAVEQKIFTTRHGPVLIRDGQSAIALSWQGLETGRSAFETFYKLNRCGELADLKAALQDFPGPPQLFVYADRWGNVGCQAAGDIPQRRGNGDGTRLNLGWTGKGDWGATSPFSRLPAADIPSSPAGAAGPKVLVAANQKLSPDGTISHASQAPLLIGHQWAPPWRANRLTALLKRPGKPIGLSYLGELQSDEFSSLALLVRAQLQAALIRTQVVDKSQLLSIKMLAAFDGQLHRQSGSATIYRAFLQTLVRRLVEPKLGRQMTSEYLERFQLWPTFVEHFLKDHPAHWLPPEERTYDTCLLTTLSQALKGTKLSFASGDPARWTWQNVHQVTFKHLLSARFPWLGFFLDVGPCGVGGDNDCLNACSVVPDLSAVHFICDTGPALRTLVDMSDQEKFYESASIGQSGHLFSPYRTDQLSHWLRADALPVAFSEMQVSRQVQHKFVLENKKFR